MLSRRISTRPTAAITIAVAASAFAVAAAAFAGAGTNDEAFIAKIKDAGVTFSSPEAAVRQGHQVCRELAGGKDDTEVAADILSQTGLTSAQATYFVAAASNTYCPQYARRTV